MGTAVSIRPSALGTKGLLLFATMELAFLATNYSNLFFLMIAFSAALGVLGAWWAIRNLRGLQIRDIEMAAAATGTARAIQLRIEGGTRPRFDLTFQLLLADKHQTVGYAPCTVGAASISDSVPGQPRSLSKLDHVRVVSRFPFGFFVARTTLAIHSELVTYPTPTAFGEHANQVGHAGDGSQVSPGRGSAVAGLRPFRDGDMMADVHWKATARRGTVVVKERERESEPALDVVLDRRCDSDVFEQVLSQLAAMVLAARHGSPLRIYSQGAELLVDPDRGGSQDALRWLADVTPLQMDAATPPGPRTAMHLPNSPRQTP
jgi:uncharacterized protein (DUF58 family)